MRDRAAVAVKPGFIGEGIHTNARDIVQARGAQAAMHIALQVELGVGALGTALEELGVGWVLLGDLVDEFRPDLITILPNARADRCGNALAACTELEHGLHGVFDNTAISTAPSGMGGSDDTGLGIGHQHGRAIGGEDAEDEAGNGRDHRIRALGDVGGFGNHQHFGGVNLEHGAKLLRHRVEMFGHAAAVFVDMAAFVAATLSAIQTGIDALADATRAAKKGVLKAWGG